MNNKSASIRAVLHQNAEGMDYEQICRATGIPRDRVAGFVAALMDVGDVKAFILEPGSDRRVFRYMGDPDRTGPHVIPTAKGGMVPSGTKGVPSARVVNFDLDRNRGNLGRLAAASDPVSEQIDPSKAEVQALSASRADSAKVPVSPDTVDKQEPQLADKAVNGNDLKSLVMENIINAASQLAAMVREQVELDDCPDLARAVKSFELAERIHEAASAG